MAFSDEKSTVVGEWKLNNKGDYMRVTKIVNTKTADVFVDVRRFYTTDSDEIKPTPKGIRINAEQLKDVIEAMAEGLEPDELEDLADDLIDKANGEDDEDGLPFK